MIDDSLLEKVSRLAEKDNRSVENMVETVLKRWVEREWGMREFRTNESYPVGNPTYRIVPDIRTAPGTTPVDPPITVCEGTTVGPNGAMFASTDNPNGTCFINGEQVGDIGSEFLNGLVTDGSYEFRHLGQTIRVPFGSEMDKHLHAIAAREQKEDKESFLADQREEVTK